MLALVLAAPAINAEVLRTEGDVKQLTTNLYGSTNQRTDSKGNVCGVLLVNSTIKGLTFDNKTAVGNVQYQNGTYYVYLSPGTKSLTVGDPRGNKLKLSFSAIDPKGTYSVTIYEGEERGLLECKSDPSGASIRIVGNGENIDLGTTPIKKNASIRVGTYDVVVSKKGFQSVTKKNVKIQAGKTTNLGTVKLKRLNK